MSLMFLLALSLRSGMNQLDSEATHRKFGSASEAQLPAAKIDQDAKTINSYDDTSRRYSSPKYKIAKTSSEKKQEHSKDNEYEDEQFDDDQYGADFDD